MHGGHECVYCLSIRRVCRNGWYDDVSACQPCQSNSVSEAGSVAQEYCYCKTGYTHAEGEFRCNACTTGTYNSHLARRAVAGGEREL